MRKLVLFSALAAVSILPCAAPVTAAPFDPTDPGDTAAMLAYVGKDDPAFAWELRGTKEMGGATIAELRLTSQQWRGIEWKHRVFVVQPKELRQPKQGVLFISGGRWRDRYDTDEGMSQWPRELPLIAAGAAQAGCMLAMVEHVPFQPMFDGKTEDALIAYSFSKWLETGDGDWPLLFPMVKSAVRAMDTVQAFARSQWSVRIEHFAVTGASKRGWTTWLAGAADARVNAIAPIVIDVLNMAKQMPHQLEHWGAYSPMIADYTRRGLPGLANSSEGAKLLRMVDPFSYRDRLTMPKLLIIGTNDAYWPLDACNIYWDDLQGPKYLTYVPNQGHGITDMARVLGAIGGMARAASSEQPFPKLQWNWRDSTKTPNALRLAVGSAQEPSAARIWLATSKNRDFRSAKWTFVELEKTATQFQGREAKHLYAYEFTPPASGYAACFAELLFPPIEAAKGGAPLHLSTTLRILRTDQAEDF
jgi:PhoPQ-activated pathogenicity-related protein